MHIAGRTYNKVDLSDHDFGVVAQDSYRLKRKVEMYQWIETYKQEKDKAYYTYAKVWSETPIDSSKFANEGFDNPYVYTWPYQSSQIQGQRIKLGKYTLD